MNTKFLMIATSVYLGIVGFGLTFLPQEIAELFNANINQLLILTLQVIGSLYLGFGMINWMTRNNLTGGIYNRPVVFGNFMHFLVSAFALIKVIGSYQGFQQITLIVVAIIYAVFALFFGYLMKNSPANLSK